MPQGIEKVMIQLIDAPTKVYAIGARLFLSKVPLEVLQNWVSIQLIASYFGKSTGSNKRSVPINKTLSTNWNQRVLYLTLTPCPWIRCINFTKVRAIQSKFCIELCLVEAT